MDFVVLNRLSGLFSAIFNILLHDRTDARINWSPFHGLISNLIGIFLYSAFERPFHPFAIIVFHVLHSRNLWIFSQQSLKRSFIIWLSCQLWSWMMTTTYMWHVLGHPFLQLIAKTVTLMYWHDSISYLLIS